MEFLNNPLDHHTAEDIAGFELKGDFPGYDFDGTPRYGGGEAEKADRAIEGILNGDVKAITLEEDKEKMEAKFEAWRQRTKQATPLTPKLRLTRF
ncbi:hypothetical protein [Neolewinella persica]|uniref:hypothetical protein n=1 Tax=Neolewinella persica TaxID=70998 RepID=UPI0003A2BA1A|nr:hypothetical protein [Neolewinella persica]